MTRKKVKLVYINNDSARKATFKKRKKGFLKKMYELTTLCEIEACAVIYSPYDAQPEAWPSSVGAQRVLSKFRRMPEMEKSKKMVNQEAFLRQRINKGVDQLKKQQKENREKEMTKVMNNCLGGKASVQTMTLMDLNDLGWLIDQQLKAIYKRIETLKKQAAAPPKPLKRAPVIEALPPPPLQPPREQQVRVVQQMQRAPMGYDNTNNFNLMDHQDPPFPYRGSWFTELMGPQDPMVAAFGAVSGGSSGGNMAGDSMLPMTFADYSNNNLNSVWNNTYFP